MKYIIVVVTFFTLHLSSIIPIQYNSDTITAVMTDDRHRHRAGAALQTSLYFEQMKLVRSAIEGLSFLFLNIIFHKLRLNYWHYCDQLLIFIA